MITGGLGVDALVTRGLAGEWLEEAQAGYVGASTEMSPLRAAMTYGSPRAFSYSRRVYTDRILLRAAIRKHKRREDEELLILLGEET